MAPGTTIIFDGLYVLCSGKVLIVHTNPPVNSPKCIRLLKIFAPAENNTIELNIFQVSFRNILHTCRHYTNLIRPSLFSNKLFQTNDLSTKNLLRTTRKQ